MKIMVGEEKKKARGPHPSGPQNSGPPPFVAPLFPGLGIHPSGHPPFGAQRWWVGWCGVVWCGVVVWGGWVVRTRCMTHVFLHLRPRMHLIGVTEHLGVRLPAFPSPRALDDKELFIIEG